MVFLCTFALSVKKHKCSVVKVEKEILLELVGVVGVNIGKKLC